MADLICFRASLKRYGAGCKPAWRHRRYAPAKTLRSGKNVTLRQKNVTEQVANLRGDIDVTLRQKRYEAGCKPAPAKEAGCKPAPAKVLQSKSPTKQKSYKAKVLQRAAYLALI
jgi:hypothetical protein